MRDGFEAKTWGEAWERDIAGDENQSEGSGARKLFAVLVPDQGIKVSASASTWILLTIRYSQLRYRHSITQPPNKPSLPETMTKMRRSLIEILVAHSAIQRISHQQRLASLALLEAVVSVFRMLSVH